jgi:uncharacterized protein YdeI (BOF family)
MKRVVGVGCVLAAIAAIASVVTTQANTQAVAQTSNSANAQTSIRDLQRANTVTISGQIVQIFSEDFILDDGTGQILVEAEDRPLREAKFTVGERVTVNGTYDDDNSFDGISITRANGAVVYVFDD